MISASWNFEETRLSVQCKMSLEKYSFNQYGLKIYESLPGSTQM